MIFRLLGTVIHNTRSKDFYVKGLAVTLTQVDFISGTMKSIGNSDLIFLPRKKRWQIRY